MDDTLWHQLPTTFDHVGTSDPRFFDRFWFAATDPAGSGTVRIADVRAVLEGAAKRAEGPEAVVVLRAANDGDSEIVDVAVRLTGSGQIPLVVTADRGLRSRLPAQAMIAGPGWLNRLLGR